MGNSPDNTDVVILAAARTPQGRINGQLASFTAVDLGAHAIKAALAASGVDAGHVEAVIMGRGGGRTGIDEPGAASAPRVAAGVDVRDRAGAGRRSTRRPDRCF